jgi:hypothetical protein
MMPMIHQHNAVRQSIASRQTAQHSVRGADINACHSTVPLGRGRSSMLMSPWFADAVSTGMRWA